MKYFNFIWIWIWILLSQFGFSQTNKIVLEDKIYNAIDAFVANPNIESLKKLSQEEKQFQAQTKSEFLALVILNCNKAYYENQFNLLQNAISSYEKAWLIFEKQKLNNYDITDSCLMPLGNLYTIMGDYDHAENIIKQYFYIANNQNNQEQKIAAILNLSNVYLSASKSELAIDLLEKTLQSEKITNNQKGLLYNNLGNNYFITKSYEKAKKAFENSLKLLKSNSVENENISTTYRNLSQIHCLEKNYYEANLYFDKALIAFNKTKNFEPRKKAKLYYEKALLLFEQDNLIGCKENIQEIFVTLLPNYVSKKIVLPTQKMLYPETVLLDALDLQAAIYVKEKNNQKALESFYLSFYIENLLQNMLVYENSKIISQVRNRNRIEKCIDIYYNLFQENGKIENIEKAFQLSETSKSSLLKNFKTQNKTISKNEKNIKIELQELQNIILKEQQKQDFANVTKINAAIKKQNELMLLLKNANSKTDIIATEKIDINTLFQKLNQDNATMLSYFSGTKNIYCFVVQKNKIELIKLENGNEPKSVIRQFIAYFKDSEAIANNICGYNNVGNLAHQYLQIPKKGVSEKLVIIPDGILNFFPFDALITKKSNTTNFAKMHYLVKDFKIGYNSSVAFYLNENQEKKSSKTDNILGVFPVFENTNLELSFSKTELQNIKKNWQGKFLEKSEATFDNFKKNASNFSILHLSTHASSGDVDEAASIRFIDQEILYSELYYLNINPNLVVLSACETGLGKLYKSEGSMSIARGFQFAGAQNLLFSLWKVNDYTTSVFMYYFYDNLKKTNSYFDANYQAKIDFLNDKDISNTKKSPYYWAPMVYYGTIENHNATNYLLFLGIGFLVLIGFFFWFWHKKNRLNK